MTPYDSPREQLLGEIGLFDFPNRPGVERQIPNTRGTPVGDRGNPVKTTVVPTDRHLV